VAANCLGDVPFDLVGDVCDHADENCPMFLTKAKLVDDRLTTDQS